MKKIQFTVQSIEKKSKRRFKMSSVVATTAVRGRFLDIQNTVAQAREIHDQVRYVEDLSLIHI